MNRLLSMMTFLIGLFFMLNAYAKNSIVVDIKHQQAKNIFNAMTGPAVQNEGTAGHLYRTGKNVVCKYINADMDDSHGHLIPNKDARRYFCRMKFNQNGLALPAIS